MALQQRIAIFLPSLAGGGAEKAMLKLANGLAERGHAVDLVLASAHGPYMSAVSARVRLVNLQAKRVAMGLPLLARYLRKNRPRALLSTLDYANIIAIWARRLARVPMVLAVLEQNTISITARQSPQLRQRMMPRLVRRFYPWADYIIGNSQGVAEDLSQLIGIPPESVKIIYNPVVTPDLEQKVRVQPVHPWFMPGEPPVLLAVGRLTAQKDFPTLIRAFGKVRQTHRARLVILGEGPDRAALEHLVHDLGLAADVSLPGFVDNPYAYMAHAALYILSSRWEGLPTVLIEALFCGVPVIATDCPSGPREILAHGRYGCLVPVQDELALAGAMDNALQGRLPTPDTQSWQPFALDTVLDQYTNLLLEHAP